MSFILNKSFFFIFATLSTVFAIQLPSEFLTFNCKKDYPYFSVGDVYVADHNYTSIISNQTILLIASLKSCKSCCDQEVLFDEIKQSIQSQEQFKQIKIGRLELTQNKQIQQQFKQIKRFPFIIYFDGKGKHHLYQEILDQNRIIRFLKRIYNPLQRFTSFKNLNEYINTVEYDSDNNPIENVKVIGLFFDKDEMKQEIQNFQEVSKDLLSRSELYFCLLTDKREVRAAKNFYQDKWFEGVSLNSIIIQRAIGVYEIIDLSDIIVDMKNLKAEIISKSLRLVDEFTMENYEFYQKDQKKQILVAVIDSILNIHVSKQLISTLESLAKQFLHKLHITWVEGNLNPEKKKMLGIPMKVQLPQIAFFRIDYQSKVIFPSSLNMTYQNLYEFINDYFTLPLIDVQKKYMNYEQKLIETKISKILTSFTILQEKNFLQKIIQFDSASSSQQYILLYFLDLEAFIENKVNEKQMKELNQVGVRIQQLFGNNVIQFHYCIKSDLEDTQQRSISTYLSKLKSNTLYFYVTNKASPFKGQLNARKILEFISYQTKSNNKKIITLPEYPEIPEEKLFEFFASNKNSTNIY